MEIWLRLIGMCKQNGVIVYMSCWPRGLWKYEVYIHVLSAKSAVDWPENVRSGLHTPSDSNLCRSCCDGHEALPCTPWWKWGFLTPIYEQSVCGYLVYVLSMNTFDIEGLPYLCERVSVLRLSFAILFVLQRFEPSWDDFVCLLTFVLVFFFRSFRAFSILVWVYMSLKYKVRNLTWRKFAKAQ